MTRRRAPTGARRRTRPAPPGDGVGMWQVRGPDGSIATGWYLLPLRLFLGVTFVFAGLQKLANPDFFQASSPISIHAQLVGASRTSPIGGLLGHLVGSASGIGAVIAVAEVAIGVGALLGLLTRVAAVGGMLVSFSLFLAISFHSAAVLHRLGHRLLLRLDAARAGRGRRGAGPRHLAGPPPGGARPPAAVADGAARGRLTRGAVVGLVAGGSAVLIGVVAGVGRALAPASTETGQHPRRGGTTTTSARPTTTAPAGGGATTTTTAPIARGHRRSGPASQVPVGGSAAFNDPSTGDPSLVIQQTADDFVAFDAICPHAGCTVAYQASAKIIACPCHGSEFNPETGAVIQGPATSGLTPIKVIKGSNGDLYVV